jgi:hypothetical protein
VACVVGKELGASIRKEEMAAAWMHAPIMKYRAGVGNAVIMKQVRSGATLAGNAPKAVLMNGKRRIHNRPIAPSTMPSPYSAV